MGMPWGPKKICWCVDGIGCSNSVQQLDFILGFAYRKGKFTISLWTYLPEAVVGESVGRDTGKVQGWREVAVLMSSG